MTIADATETVCSAAAANANGHSNCVRIMEAVQLVRAYMRDEVPIEPMNGCTITCEGCADEFIPVHDETLCRKCTEAKEDERAWQQHGLAKWGSAMRDVWVAGYQRGRKEA